MRWTCFPLFLCFVFTHWCLCYWCGSLSSSRTIACCKSALLEGTVTRRLSWLSPHLLWPLPLFCPPPAQNQMFCSFSVISSSCFIFCFGTRRLYIYILEEVFVFVFLNYGFVQTIKSLTLRLLSLTVLCHIWEATVKTKFILTRWNLTVTFII